ncbi:MAG: ABC transporter permease [Lagierella massiliensis]|nr:ABC transporter permease [Lagierella massiliensis]
MTESKKRAIYDPKKQNILIPLFAIVLSLIVASIILLILGKNPLSAFYNLLQGTGLAPKARYAGGKSMVTDFADFLNALTPMIFASLAVMVALKGGLFNIGVSGQMLVAGFVTTVLIGYSELSAYVAKPLVIVIGFIIGATVGGLIGFLKYRFNINEVVSSIMINYMAQYVIAFFINTKYVDPVSRQSKNIGQNARLTLMNMRIGGFKINIPLAIVLAIITVFLIKFIMDKTVTGFEIKSVGAGSLASKYIGINVSRKTVQTMFISGGLAGVAGVTYFLGYYGSIRPNVLPAVGFDAIAVCLLGNSSPIGIVFASFIINLISEGGNYMSSQAGVDREISAVITGLILLFSACGAYFKYKLNSMEKTALKENKEKKGEENA